MFEQITKIKDIMTRQVLFARLHHSLKELGRFFLEMNIHHLPVLNESDEIVGMLSSNDVLRAFSYQDSEEESMARVEQLMTPAPIVSIRPEDTVQDAVRLFTDKKINALAIVDNSQKIMGIITATDLIKHLATLKERIRFI